MPTTTPFIQDWFSAVAAEIPWEIAIACGLRRVTYAALEERSNRLANRLLAAETGRAPTVAILSADPVEVVTAILGVLKAGGVFVPLDVRHPSARLQAALDAVTPDWLLTDAATAAAAGSLSLRARPMTVEEAASGGMGARSVRPDVRYDPDAPCYISFSSGSTGRPKGIVGRLKAIAHFIRWEIAALDLGRGVRVSQLTAPGFDAILRDIFVPLCAGGTLCAPERREDMLEPATLLRWLEDERIALLHCVPSLFFTLLNEPLTPERLPALRHILLAGEVVPPGAVDRWFAAAGPRIALVNLYGPSETTMIKFAHRIRDEDRRRPSVPIGRPIDGAEALILDEQDRPCGPGTVGQIHIRTPYRSLGYLDRPDLTAAAFIPAPAGLAPTGLSSGATKEDILYRTGDLGRCLPDGTYEFLGRMDAQVKIRGVRVELAEVEEALRSHPAVRDAGAAAVPAPDGGLRLCAWVTMADAASPDGVQGRPEEALRDHLAETLSDEMLPSTITVVASLPRTSSGKLDRAGLASLPSTGPAGGETEAGAPRTDTERRLAAIWSAVLGREGIGVDDDFFRAGGHSLQAMSMIARARREFDVDLPLRRFFAGPTIAGLAGQIDTLRAETAGLEFGEL